MMVPEDAILKPVFKPNPDDWPIFSLRKGNVLSQETGQPVSLLSASMDHPVRVTGYLLDIEDDLQHLIRNKNYKKKPIELTDVILYAYAEYDDGTYGFWAAGKAGWFEFDSFAPPYQTIHNHMSEATSLVYILADRLRQSIVKSTSSLEGGNLKRYMQRIFLHCISRAGNPAKFIDVEDVEDAFREHRMFLITCMLEGQEGIKWLDSPLFAYFKKHYPKDVAELTARIIPPPSVSKAEIPASPIGAPIEAPIEAPMEAPMEVPIEAILPSKKRRSESPHIKEPKPKKKKKASALRKLPTPLPTPLTPPSKILQDAEGSEEELDDLNAITHKRKSILRPSGSKSAKRAKTAPTGRSALPIKVDENSNSDTEPEKESDGFPITTIANAEHLNLLTNPPPQSHDHDLDDPYASAPRFLPRKYLELSLAEYEIPSTAPQGPGGLWRCPFEGCHARVHQAATTSGQDRVKDHLKTHITNTKAQINLVLDESRPYLPVDNLVRRLQAFAPPLDEDPPAESIERAFSAPIRRRY